MNLAIAFAQSAGLRRDKTALCWGESEWTYAALLAGAETLAGN